MRDRLCRALTSWPLVGALAVLLVNDAWLKGAHPGFLAGKLSDFAGIAVVALLLLAIRPARPLVIYAACAAVFAWWKSPWSQPFIELVNAYAPVRFGRVVDYTDLVALVVLPACSHVVAHERKFAIPWPAVRRLLLLPVIAGTVFGTAATSALPPAYPYDDDGPVSRERVHEGIASEAARHGLVCDACPLSDGTMLYQGSGLLMSYTFSGPRTISFTIEPWPDRLLWSASACRKAVSLRTDLKAMLAKQRWPLEYLEPRKPSKECR